jgi:hypothetical protein
MNLSDISERTYTVKKAIQRALQDRFCRRGETFGAVPEASGATLLASHRVSMGPPFAGYGTMPLISRGKASNGIKGECQLLYSGIKLHSLLSRDQL